MIDSFVLHLPKAMGDILSHLAIQRGRTPERQLLHWVRIGLVIEGNRSNPHVERMREQVTDLLENASCPLNDEDVLQQAKDARGTLVELLLPKGAVYQTCKDHPELIEQVMPGGFTTVGRFVNGAFIPAGEI